MNENTKNLINKNIPKINNKIQRKKRQNNVQDHTKNQYSNRTLLRHDLDSLHYTDSESYGVRAVKRTHWAEDIPRHVVIDPKKTTCMLYLQADHLFYQKMGSDEACIEAMTRHVQKVNSIYRNTGQSSFSKIISPCYILFLYFHIFIVNYDLFYSKKCSIFQILTKMADQIIFHF